MACLIRENGENCHLLPDANVVDSVPQLVDDPGEFVSLSVSYNSATLNWYFLPQTVGKVSPVRICGSVGTFLGPTLYSWRSQTRQNQDWGRQKGVGVREPEPQMPAHAFFTLTQPGLGLGSGMSSTRMSLLPWNLKARMASD